ncbi:MAG: hypothetical protein ABIH83_00900 [Candidatus Micrarchaeota archaeon]
MGIKPDKLSDLKISKNTYSFIQRKRYSPVSHYNVKKSKSDNPIASLIETIKNYIASQKRKEKKKKEKDLSSLRFDATFSIAIKVAAVALALLIMLIIWFVLALGPGVAGLQAPPTPPGFNGTFEMQVYDAGLVTFGRQGESLMQGYIVLDYAQEGLSNLSIASKLYSSPPSRQVFILQHRRDGADTYPEFRKTFDKRLASKGWIVNDIHLEDLNDLPGGSTLIIPTGYFPSKLMGSKDDSFPSIIDLAKRGVVVIFIGQAFDKQVMSQNGQFLSADTELLEKMGIKFERNAKISSEEGFLLGTPLYSVSSKHMRPTMLWGSISQLSYGNGYLLFLPQSLDGGWTGNGVNAGEDIARLVTDEPFRIPITSTYYSSNSSPSSYERLTFYFEPISQQSANLRIIYSLNDTSGIVQERFVDWPMRRSARGELYIDDSVLTPEYLGGGRKTVIAELKEPEDERIKLYFELYQNGSTIEQMPVEQGLTSTKITRSAPVQFNQAPDQYLLRVVDRFGKVYAATRVEMAGLEIRAEEVSYRDSSFNFSFYSGGKRIKVPYAMVSVKGNSNAKTSEYKNTDFINYRPGIEFKRGDYAFIFDFGGGYSQERPMPYNIPLNIWERPEVVILFIIALLTFGAGIYLRRPQKQPFSLDIPDFPPHTVKKISLPTSRVLSIFEQMNRDYRWVQMPLSPDELKAGFRKIIVDGRPVIIGDYNLQRMLEKLEEKKLVASELGFYVPASWIASSGFPIKLLASYRYLRDLFVNNAIRFSKLRAVKGCDIKIIIGRSEYFLHIYLGDDSIVEQALSTVSRGRTWILFASNAEKEEFEQKLRSSSFLILKMHVESGKIKLFSLEQISKVLKKLRVSY